MFDRLIQTEENWASFAARLALGIVIFPHGAQKMLGMFGGPGFGGTLDFFSQQLGIPAILTILVIFAEFFGSLGLIVGLLSRVAAAGIGLVMLGAVFMVNLPYGFFMNWFGMQAGEGIEYHILALGLAAAVIIAGSGALSVDAALAKRRAAAAPAPAPQF